jgi:hypothetical protein
MKKLITGILIGMFMGTLITAAIAKYESESKDAASQVGYGKVAATGAIVQFKVASDGTLSIN